MDPLYVRLRSMSVQIAAAGWNGRPLHDAELVKASELMAEAAGVLDPCGCHAVGANYERGDDDRPPGSQRP